jgi:hypothetical protein
MKDLLPADAESFWGLLSQENDLAFNSLKYYTVTPGDVVAYQPVWMCDELYNKYLTVLHNWLIENGIL